MKPVTDAARSSVRLRYGDVEKPKAIGATYTPVELAKFVAVTILGAAKPSSSNFLRVLDPAVGDGALLDALVSELPHNIYSKLCVVGFDTDALAVDEARSRLQSKFPEVTFQLEVRDFLRYASEQRADDLLSHADNQLFDLIIANPPYVRTQIMGSRQAQLLAKSFGLTGRVDLYYPFLLSISTVLSPEGFAGVITSNRFMTTKSGYAVRQALLDRFEVMHVWDLGDSKLFDAAVLPSVLLAKGVRGPGASNTSSIKYTSIYETNGGAIDAARMSVDAVDALNSHDGEVRAVPDGRRFIVRHGVLDNGGSPGGVWRISTTSTDAWLSTVSRNTWDTFRRIGKIRVGVKSTADKIFIRSDWDSLKGGRPELLRPLITRHGARRFRAEIPTAPSQRREILYPHRATNTGREAVELDLHPIARRYLEDHRAVLEARTYVAASGRKWYEIWVPQDPGAWKSPKLVFPDISQKPVFWMDLGGGVVNGECYWLKCDREEDEHLLWLALAVANSSFVESFYDHRFNNKLYAGRRRFITQYVEQFPLPNPECDASRLIVSLAKRIYELTPSEEADALSSQLDEKVWEIFGLEREELAG